MCYFCENFRVPILHLGILTLDAYLDAIVTLIIRKRRCSTDRIALILKKCMRRVGARFTPSVRVISRQCCDDACGTVSLATMELLENGVATYFGATPLWSMRTVIQASSQRWREMTLTLCVNRLLLIDNRTENVSDKALYLWTVQRTCCCCFDSRGVLHAVRVMVKPKNKTKKKGKKKKKNAKCCCFWNKGDPFKGYEISHCSTVKKGKHFTLRMTGVNNSHVFHCFRMTLIMNWLNSVMKCTDLVFSRFSREESTVGEISFAPEHLHGTKSGHRAGNQLRRESRGHADPSCAKQEITASRASRDRPGRRHHPWYHEHWTLIR